VHQGIEVIFSLMIRRIRLSFMTDCYFCWFIRFLNLRSLFYTREIDLYPDYANLLNDAKSNKFLFIVAPLHKPARLLDKHLG